MDKIVGGLLLIGIGLFDLSTGYITEKYLLPTQDSDLLRNVFSAKLHDILFLVLGAKQIWKAFLIWANSAEASPGYENRGVRPDAEERKMTKEEWKAQAREGRKKHHE